VLYQASSGKEANYTAARLTLRLVEYLAAKIYRPRMFRSCAMMRLSV